MEYTKDVIFNVRYDEVHNVIKTGGNKKVNKVFQTLKRHKVMTMTTLAAIIFIGIDAVLVTNFFRILTVL